MDTNEYLAVKQMQAEKLVTIQDIRGHEWVGNAFSDSPAFMAIDAFIQREDVSVEDRIEALEIMGRDGMGIDEPVTVKDVVLCVLCSLGSQDAQRALAPILRWFIDRHIAEGKTTNEALDSWNAMITELGGIGNL